MTFFADVALGKYIKLITAFLIVALLAGTVLAQGGSEVIVSAEVNRETITVGDRLVYTVRAEHDKSLVVDFPQLGSAWGDFEVLSQRPLRPGTSQGRVITGKEYVITAFTVGEHTTPPLRVSYLDSQGRTQEVETDPIRITVTSVLSGTEGVTSTLDIRDLKPQAELPRDWSLLPWAGLAGLAAALALPSLLWFLTRRRKRAGAAAPTAVVDLRPPEQIAYEELERIAGLKLIEQSRFKEYYTLTADCLRRYAEGIYGVPAMDRTTEEFHAALWRARVDGQQVRLLKDFLAESDLVKFAKYVPPVEEAREALPRARYIVDVTKPKRVDEGLQETGRSSENSSGSVIRRSPSTGSG
ncbi:MAG: BatD family protein [Anaerolineae bacterium]|nr:BatD family protein [Anaerolineae bacterium]